MASDTTTCDEVRFILIPVYCPDDVSTGQLELDEPVYLAQVLHVAHSSWAPVLDQVG